MAIRVVLRPGDVFARDFRVLRVLSQGGMGALYVVEQISTGSERALKLMLPSLVHHDALRRRFELEAQASAKIASDHVVQVIAAGIDDETGSPWLAMELLDGMELNEMVDAKGGRLTPAVTREVLGQLCHALGAAHEAGIVHRDLKPENIFIARGRRKGEPFTIKVLDFGIAKLLEEAKSVETAPIGSPLWMAPEQSEAGSAISPATDVWSLGLLAFWLLTGKHYWSTAEDASVGMVSVLRELLLNPLVPASARARATGTEELLPAGFDAWFARCVCREPEGRFANAGEAHAALDVLLDPGDAEDNAKTTVIASIPAPAAPPVAARPRRAIVLGAIGASIAVVLLTVAVTRDHGSLPPESIATVVASAPAVTASAPPPAPEPTVHAAIVGLAIGDVVYYRTGAVSFAKGKVQGVAGDRARIDDHDVFAEDIVPPNGAEPPREVGAALIFEGPRGALSAAIVTELGADGQISAKTCEGARVFSAAPSRAKGQLPAKAILGSAAALGPALVGAIDACAEARAASLSAADRDRSAAERERRAVIAACQAKKCSFLHKPSMEKGSCECVFGIR